MTSKHMPARKCVTISISPELHAVAERLLTSGRYGNFSEVVDEGTHPGSGMTTVDWIADQFEAVPRA